MSQTTVEYVVADQNHAAVLSEMHGHGFSSPWSPTAFVDLLKQGTVQTWIAMAPDPNGFIATQMAADEAEILTLVVVNSRRRQGLGRLLVMKALSELTRLGAVTCHLEVAEDNARALGLYRACGFSETGRRIGYYTRPDGFMDAILMSKLLNKGSN